MCCYSCCNLLFHHSHRLPPSSSQQITGIERVANSYSDNLISFSACLFKLALIASVSVSVSISDCPLMQIMTTRRLSMTRKECMLNNNVYGPQKVPQNSHKCKHTIDGGLHIILFLSLVDMSI